jgi:hypothetical protein
MLTWKLPLYETSSDTLGEGNETDTKVDRHSLHCTSREKDRVEVAQGDNTDETPDTLTDLRKEYWGARVFFYWKHQR